MARIEKYNKRGRGNNRFQNSGRNNYNHQSTGKYRSNNFSGNRGNRGGNYNRFNNSNNFRGNSRGIRRGAVNFTSKRITKKDELTEG